MYRTSARRARHSLTWVVSAAVAVTAGVFSAQLTAHPKRAPLAASLGHAASLTSTGVSGSASLSGATSSTHPTVESASFETTGSETGESNGESS